MMSWLSVMLMSVALLAVVGSRRVTGDYFTPTALVMVTWCGALSLYLLHLLPYPPVQAETLVFVVAAVALMVGGSLLGARSGAAPVADSAWALPVPLRADAWVAAFSLLGLVGVAQYIHAIGSTVGIDAFLDDPARIRLGISTRAIPNTFLFLTYFCIVAPITACALRLAGVRLHRRTWLLVGAVTIATWITTDRTAFFTVALTCYFMYVFRHGPRLSWLGLGVLTSVVGLALVANFLIVGTWLGKTPANLGVRMSLPSTTASGVLVDDGAAAGSADGDSTVEPAGTDAAASGGGRSALATFVGRGLQTGSTLYLYATGSFASLDSLLTDPLPRTNGLHSAYPVARALSRLGLVTAELPPAVAPFRPLPVGERSVPFNAYTYLYYPLTDFGPVGALGYATAVGLFSGIVYRFARRRRWDPVALLLTGQVSLALLLSIFVNKFNNTASWYILALSLAPFIAARVGLVRRRPTAGSGPEDCS